MALSDACFDALLGIEEYQETMGYEELADRCRNVKLELAILGSLAENTIEPGDEKFIRQKALAHAEWFPPEKFSRAIVHAIAALNVNSNGLRWRIGDWQEPQQQLLAMQ